MTASRANSLGRYQHPRADDEPFIDRVTQRNVDKLATTNIATSDIANRGEASFNRRTREHGSPDRHFRDVRR